MATVGTRRRKTGSLKIRPYSPISWRKLRRGAGAAPGGAFGTENQIQTETETARPASTTKTPRQPMKGSAHCTGIVAASPPMEAKNRPAPVTAATRSFGYHCVLALSIAISPAATPTPATQRPAASIQTSADNALMLKPVAATRASVACTRRGPFKSNAKPIGNCAMA